MPLAYITVIEGDFTSTQKQQMIKQITEAMSAIEGEARRDETFVILEEIKSGDWSFSGETLTTQHARSIRSSA